MTAVFGLQFQCECQNSVISYGEAGWRGRVFLLSLAFWPWVAGQILISQVLVPYRQCLAIIEFKAQTSLNEAAFRTKWFEKGYPWMSGDFTLKRGDCIGNLYFVHCMVFLFEPLLPFQRLTKKFKSCSMSQVGKEERVTELEYAEHIN